MGTIQNLRRIRFEKLEKIKTLGVNPFPARCFRQQKINEALTVVGRKVTVVGRIKAIRGHGGIQFFDLYDESGKIQLVSKKEGLNSKDKTLLTLLDIGDFIEASGEIFKTKSGETSIDVEKFTILVKALRPLPSVWYGLKDVEERYRKRYLDLLLNPAVKETFKKRSKIISAVREFLDKDGFLEVETPTLQEVYGGASAQPFKTHHNSLNHDLFLKISDELYLKRLIIGGLEKVYEIDKDFRNEGIDKFHNPEFTMMECYWAYTDYQKIMKLTEDLYSFVCQKVLGTTKVKFGPHEIDFKTPWQKITMKEGLKKYAEIDIDKLSDEEIKNLLKKHKLVTEDRPTLTGVAADFSRGIAIATLFELVEP